MKVKKRTSKLSGKKTHLQIEGLVKKRTSKLSGKKTHLQIVW